MSGEGALLRTSPCGPCLVCTTFSSPTIHATSLADPAGSSGWLIVPCLIHYHVTWDAICSTVTLWPRLDVEKRKLRPRESECLSHMTSGDPRGYAGLSHPW